MILLDKRLTDLVSGYGRVRKADLQSTWRHRLLATYTRRREAYDVARARHQQQTADLRPKVVIGLVVTGILFLLGMFLGETHLSILFMLGELVGGGLLGIAWLWRAVISSPKPPQHPLQEPLKAKLFPPLLPLWRERLRGQLPTHVPYEGFTGESDFVKSLQRLQCDSSYIIYRLRQRPGDDVDVTVVGPKGVWVFEVKYWSGRITWHNGRWSHEKPYYKPGGIPAIESKEVEQPPDQQWRRMADDVAETLRRRVPWLVARLPALAQIKGGLVFSHPEAIYDIARDCPCAWGTIAGWTRELSRTPTVPGVSEGVALQILDALLSRHRQVSEDEMTISMDTYAAQLVQKAEAHLVEWIQN